MHRIRVRPMATEYGPLSGTYNDELYRNYLKLTDKTTLFFPPDAEVLRLLHFDAQPAPGEPSPDATTPVGAAGSPQEPSAVSADADRLLKKKSGEALR